MLPAAVPPITPLHVVHAFSAVGRYAAGDRGVDLAGTPGEAVVSATAGTVSFAGPVGGQGVVSVRIGGGRVLTYEPVSPAVHAGSVVAAGTALGRLAGGHPGCPAAACLHWGLRLADGTYADPLALLGPPRVRLLPLPGGGGPTVPLQLPPQLPAAAGGGAALGALGAAARLARAHLRS